MDVVLVEQQHSHAPRMAEEQSRAPAQMQSQVENAAARNVMVGESEVVLGEFLAQMHQALLAERDALLVLMQRAGYILWRGSHRKLESINVFLLPSNMILIAHSYLCL